jgi:hypothetical protein
VLGERRPDVVADNKTGVQFLNMPRRLEAAGGHVGSGCPLNRYNAQSGVKVNVDV